MGGVVRRYIDFLIILLIPLHLYTYWLFFCSSIPTSLFIFKMFFINEYLSVLNLPVELLLYTHIVKKSEHFAKSMSNKGSAQFNIG